MRIAAWDGPSVHGVALVDSDRGLLAAWSERGGLFVAPLDGAAPPARIGPACDGGLASDGPLLACSRRGDDAKAQSGHVELRDLRRGVVLEVFDGVGPQSTGVSVAETPRGWALAWNDARTTDASVRFVESGAELVRLSRERARAGAPALRFQRAEPPQLITVWPETRPAPGGVVGSLQVRTERRSLDFEPIAFDASNPTIALDDVGRAVVVWRDRRPQRSRAKVFLRRLADDARAHEGVPANAEGGAFGLVCAGAMVVVAPRTHSRTERLVAVRRHDPRTLEGAGPEHQIYRYGEAFEYADARCVDDRVVLVVASRPTVAQRVGAVSTMSFRCAEPSTR